MPPPIPITGSPRNDQITGTPSDDVIDALPGNDVVRAGGGADDVRGNLGNDKLFGEEGADRLSGDQGNDDIDGGDGLDTAVYTGSRDDYQITTDANGETQVKDLRGGRPDGIDHVVNTEFFEFADGTFQLQDGVLVPVPSDTDGFIGSTATFTLTFEGLSNSR
jgi:Ca2+-binding RTX toxin-like protein